MWLMQCDTVAPADFYAQSPRLTILNNNGPFALIKYWNKNGITQHMSL